MITKSTKLARKDRKEPLCVFVIVVLAVGLVSSASGCASAQAKAPSSTPPLNVPPPPPHVVAPAPELPSMPEPVGELPPPPAGQPTRTARPPAPKPSATEKPETKPGEAKAPEVAPVEQPKEAPKPPEPAPQLVTPQTADTNTAANAVRQTIDRAQGLLNSIDYGHLSNERKKAYNDAKMFLQQADKALQQNNLAFAQGVATKAETLAHELAGR